MKKIDDFITQHAGMFDSEEPDQGHLDRFMDRIYAMHAIKRNHSHIVWLRIAAILALTVIISYAAFREFGLIEKQLNIVVPDMSNREFREAEQYYNSQLSICYNKIRNLRFNNDPAEKKQVLQELSSMDEQVKDMKHDLRQNPDDERIVQAIIGFYQLKIEVMDVIIARAQKSNNTI